MSNTGSTDGTSISSATYTSLANVKAYLTATGGNDAALLADDITAADDWLDAQCGWGFHSETRTDEQITAPYVFIDREGSLLIRVDKCPLTAVSAVSYRVQPTDDWTVVDNAVTPIEMYPTLVTRPLAYSNLICCYIGRSDLRFEKGLRVKVTYTGGFSPIPAGLEWLARRICAWKYKQKDSAGQKVAMPAMGQLLIPDAVPADIAKDLLTWRRKDTGIG